jgi:NAD-dependent SIR2 family protein deacetylase
MFGEAAPEYVHIQEAIRQCSLFISIGTSGAVIDIVPIVKSFKHSILIDPKRQETRSMYDPKTYVDEYFEHFIQKKASEAMDEMMTIVKNHLDG